MPFEWAPISQRQRREENFVATFLTGRKWEKFKLPRPPGARREKGERASKLERESERAERSPASRYIGGRPKIQPQRA